ncbi:taste receptor type 2 member 119-like [Mixophyes fleayi]|uniref:taste receptor type 2 member 119-like n=1 Tax=Mixophyes fleayi TaxID=3061075 RepID=UPI003F4DC968
MWVQWYSIKALFYIVNYTTLYGITSSLWLSASLCLFYMIKIINVQSRTLTWVKMKISIIVPWLILTAEIVSLCGSFLSFLIPTQQPAQNNSTIITLIIISEDNKPKLQFMNIVLMINSLPSLIAITATASSAWCLKVYDCQMKRNMGTFGNTNVKDYQCAVQTMVYLEFFHTFIFLVMVMFSLEIFANNSWGYWIIVIVLFSFGTVQSAILTHGNPNLKRTMKQIFSLSHISNGSTQ